MADTAVPITAGTGTNIDTRTEATNGNHRQVIVVGDPSTNAGVAPVDATAGLKVDLGADNDITGTVTANIGTAGTLATAAKQDTIIGHVDGMEGLLTTIDADTGNIDTSIGASGDASVAAGATGSVQAKLRRLTTDLDSVKTNTANIPASPATAGNQTTANTALSAIQTAVETLDNVVSGSEAQVDIVASLPAGTNNIGDVDVLTLPALPAGTNNIGDVDVLTLPPVNLHATRANTGEQSTTITSSTSATTIVNAEAAIYRDIVSITVRNKDSVGTEVILYDDDGTTERWAGYAPATDMRGITFPVPLKAAAVNATWKMKTVTSINNLKVTIQFVKNT